MTDVPDNLIVLEDLIRRRKLQELEKEIEEAGAPLDEETKLWLEERLKALEASKQLSRIKTDKTVRIPDLKAPRQRRRLRVEC